MCIRDSGMLDERIEKAIIEVGARVMILDPIQAYVGANINICLLYTSRHFPAIHWLTSYSEYLEDLSPWYRDNVSAKFVSDRNQLMAILNQESSLMEIVKLIGSDVLPDDQKLTLEIARVIRLGFLQQNAFHAEDTCVPMSKQFNMMEIILYLYEKCRSLVNQGMPVSVLKEDNIFERVIAIKYDVPNNKPEMFDQYKADIDRFYDNVLERNG